jgi:hypothetical protein
MKCDWCNGTGLAHDGFSGKLYDCSKCKGKGVPPVPISSTPQPPISGQTPASDLQFLEALNRALHPPATPRMGLDAVWVSFASAYISNPEHSIKFAPEKADMLLIEYKKRLAEGKFDG